MRSSREHVAESCDRNGPQATSLATNLRTLLLLLLCALPVFYGADRIENSAADDSASDPRPYRVDLNSAGPYELLLLDGVGEATAHKIIADRDAAGPYATLDDLQRVKGIGPKTVQKLRPHVRIGGVVGTRIESLPD